MPSTRVSNFDEPGIITDPSRQRPPQSEGLMAPSDVLERADKRRRERHPAKPGPMDEEKADATVALTMRLMDSLSMSDIATKAGVGVGAVSEVIKGARLTLQQRAKFYVEAHAVATIAAAAEGNAKPAQWALERIAEGDDRIIDQPKADAATAPATFNIGFKIGGLPEGATMQKAIEGEVAK